MTTSKAPAGASLDYRIWQVITASAVGTMQSSLIYHLTFISRHFESSRLLLNDLMFESQRVTVPGAERPLLLSPPIPIRSEVRHRFKRITRISVTEPGAEQRFL